jgi:mannosyltransferase
MSQNRPVAPGPVAAGPVAAGPVAAGPVAAGPVAVSPAPDEAAAARPGHAVYRVPGWLVFVIPMLAELVIGGYKLGGPSLWRDEGYTINSSQRSVSQILALTWHQDAVHGLYYLLMHFVIGAFGTSAVVLRLPSLLAMCLAAGVTAVLGRRLALASALPAPSVTGIMAGLLVAAVPLTTYYSEDARPYGLVSLFALISTYALVRAATEHRWGWWAVYTAAIVLAVTLDLFTLLLVVAHGMSLAYARLRTPAQQAAGRLGRLDRLGRPLGQWLSAAGAAVVLLAPVLYLGYRQAGTLSWIRVPDMATVTGLARDLAGATPLIPLVTLLAIGGAAANLRSRRSGPTAPRLTAPALTAPLPAQAPTSPAPTSPGLAPAGLSLPVVALPWLVLPPVLLLSVSELHPVYTERYVLYCFPALSLLTAAGLAWVARLASGMSFGRRSVVLAVLPSAVLAAVLAAFLAGPQLGVRITSNRTDDLETVTAIVGANERPGDAVFYLPQTTRVVGMAYPTPFRRLRDVALGRSPASSATLLGEEVAAPVLTQRLAGIRRVWTVNWVNSLTPLSSDRLAGQEEAQVSHMRLIERWHVMSVVLTLYASR